MNNNYKYLVWAGTGTLIILSVFLLTATKQIKNTSTTTNTISFSGEGKIFVKPDIAAISFSIVTEATTSKKAQDDNSEKSQKIVEFLKSQNIDDKDVKTTGYNVYPQYSYPRPLPLGVDNQSFPAPEYYPSNPKITGYQVNQSFQVKVRDLGKISAILDGLISAGANQVNNLGLQVDDIEKVKDEARELAIENAKEKANTLKKQLGIRLGKIVNYNEGGGGYPIYYAETRALDSGVSGGGPEIPTGENEITINVTITYQIK